MKGINKVWVNAGSSVLPQFINVLINFTLPIMIIGIYGSSINGLLSTVKTIVSYVALVGAGISVATTQALYKPVAKGDVDTVKGMLRATGDLFNRCGFFYLIVICFISILYPFCVHEEEVSYITVSLLILVVSLSGASEFFVVGRCRSLLYANQQVYICSIIQSISLVVSLIVGIISICLQLSIIIVQLAISSVYILRAIFLLHYVKKVYPQYIYDRSTVPINSAIEKRNDAMIHQLTNLLVFGSQSIILSSMVGFKAASIYSIYGIIFIGITSICANLNVAITPFIGKSLSISSIDKVRKEFSILEFLFFIITSLIFMVCISVVQPFIHLYTKNADINYVYPLVSILFVVVYIFNIYRLPHSALITASGLFKETRKRAIAEASICVIFSVFFTHFFQIYGVLIGTGIAIGWRCIDMIYYTHRIILGNSMKIVHFRLVRIFLLVSISYLFWKNIIFAVDNYYQLFLLIFIVFLGSVLLLLFDIFLFDRKSFFKTLSFIKSKYH